MKYLWMLVLTLIVASCSNETCRNCPKGKYGPGQPGGKYGPGQPGGEGCCDDADY